MGQERRGHPRYDVMAQIRVKRGRTNYIMDVKNISIAGMLVESESIKNMPWFRVDQELEMDIFTTADLDNVRLKGRIARIIETEETGKDGFGVAFDDPDPESMTKLAVIVDRASQDSVRPPPLPEVPANPKDETQEES